MRGITGEIDYVTTRAGKIAPRKVAGTPNTRLRNGGKNGTRENWPCAVAIAEVAGVTLKTVRLPGLKKRVQTHRPADGEERRTIPVTCVRKPVTSNWMDTCTPVPLNTVCEVASA